jgi:DegV family protein with EDD domain
VHVVPLHVAFGERQFLDKLTIQPDLFYRRLESDPEFPKTSQPAVAVFLDMYRQLEHHYHSIVSIHLSGGLSGTLNSARLAAQQVKGLPIAVVDSKNLSTSLGLMVLRIAEAIAAGKRFPDVVRLAESLPAKTKLLVGIPTLKSYIRGGRVSPLKGWVARLLNLKPIVSVDEDGKAVLFGKAFSKKANLAKIISWLGKMHGVTPVRRYAVAHTSAEAEAKDFAHRLEAVLGMPAEYLTHVSPVIGAHAGPGSICVSVMTGE